jgi:basic amino acid/polyamine antiporter, APA family
MSRQGWLPEGLNRLSPRRRTPMRAVAVVGGLILAVARGLPHRVPWCGGLLSGGFLLYQLLFGLRMGL